MGNLVSFSTPKSEATNFHQLSALDIDKAPVDFASLDGKVGAGAAPAHHEWQAALSRPVCSPPEIFPQVVLVSNVASK